MKIIRPNDSHIAAMMTWFSTEQESSAWAGPNFNYPYSQQSFTNDLNMKKLSSYVLVSNNNILAFGQIYRRLNRCHLGRLVVNPRERRRGLAGELIHLLCRRGREELELSECSLFVLENNMAAVAAYEKYGFSVAKYPETIPLDNCLYMLKKFKGTSTN